jgi:hypothetical protein
MVGRIILNWIFQEMGFEDADWIHLARVGFRLLRMVMNLFVLLNVWNFFAS